jgi:hypothetical protein
MATRQAYLIVVVDFQVQNLESNLARFEFLNGLLYIRLFYMVHTTMNAHRSGVKIIITL